MIDQVLIVERVNTSRQVPVKLARSVKSLIEPPEEIPVPLNE